MDTIETKVRAILRERGIFEIAARSQADWVELLRIDIIPGPRGGIPACLRRELKLLENIKAVGAETAMTNLVDQFVNAARRWEQLHRPGMEDTFPYFQYHTVGDDRVRPMHAAMNNFLARCDDPIWATHWPPWEYNCRCTVTAVSIYEAQDAGVEIKETGKGIWLADDGTILFSSPIEKSFDPFIYQPPFAWNPGKDLN